MECDCVGTPIHPKVHLPLKCVAVMNTWGLWSALIDSGTDHLTGEWDGWVGGWTGGMESRGGIRTDLELQWLGRAGTSGRQTGQIGWEPLRIPIWVGRFAPSPACFSRPPPDPDRMGRKVEGRWNGMEGVSVTSEPPAGPSDGERASDCPSPFSFNFLGKGCYRLAELLSKQAAKEKGKERTGCGSSPSCFSFLPITRRYRGLCSGDSFIVLPDLALLFWLYFFLLLLSRRSTISYPHHSQPSCRIAWLQCS